VTSYTSEGIVVVTTTYVPTTYVLVGDTQSIDALNGPKPAPTAAVVGGTIGAAALIAALAGFFIIRSRRKRNRSSRGGSEADDLNDEINNAFNAPRSKRSSGYGTYGSESPPYGGGGGTSPYGTSGYDGGRSHVEDRRPSFVPRDDDVNEDIEVAMANVRNGDSGRWSPKPWLNAVFRED
jgi:hypothetical protein